MGRLHFPFLESNSYCWIKKEGAEKYANVCFRVFETQIINVYYRLFLVIRDRLITFTSFIFPWSAGQLSLSSYVMWYHYLLNVAFDRMNFVAHSRLEKLFFCPQRGQYFFV